MSKRFIFSILFLFLFTFLLLKPAAEDTQRHHPGVPQVEDFDQFDVNNIRAYVTNYGSLFRHPIHGNSGFEWPKESGIYAIYAAGLWVGARVNGETRVAVADYAYEYAPGTIDPNTHLPKNPEDPTFQVYKINKGETNSWDYLHWPVQDGAPLDQNGNPLIIGDQTLWCVYNDADSAVHTRMHSRPLGVEVQQTVFGWNQDYKSLYDVVFLRWLLINKSGQTLDSAYFTIWCDADLGDSGNDMTGTDSTLQLGFIYNVQDEDYDYGEHPPAVGIMLMQGPIIPSPGDTAFFYGKEKIGYKNMPVSSIVCPLKPQMYNNGSPVTTQDVYNLMQARWKDGRHMTYGGMGDDSLSWPTNFMYIGDPVTGTGWLDPYPADKRFVLNCGPVTLAPGDSQEVMVATLIARGTSHLNSLTRLKERAQDLREISSRDLFHLPTQLNYQLSYPNPQTNRISFHLYSDDATAVTGELYTYGEPGGSDTLLQSFAFFDDGQHGDGEANDGRWGAILDLPCHPHGGYVNLSLTLPDGRTIRYPKAMDEIPLAGKLEVTRAIIGSDNLNNDGQVNPGENIRYTLELFNHSSYDLENIQLYTLGPKNREIVYTYGTNQVSGWTQAQELFPIAIPYISAHSGYNWEYAPGSPYFFFNTHTGIQLIKDFSIFISLKDENKNNWRDTLNFRLQPLLFEPQYEWTELSSGDSQAKFKYVMINPWEITGHQYQISFAEQNDTTLVYNLRDLTTGEDKLTGQSLPDPLGHTSPIVDGFKILQGDMEYDTDLYTIELDPVENVWLNYTFYFDMEYFFYHYRYTIYIGNKGKKWQGNVPFWRYPNLKIEFDSTRISYCKVYRIDQDYHVQPGLGVFYGAAYDISDPDNPRRLNIVFYGERYPETGGYGLESGHQRIRRRRAILHNEQ